MLFTNVVQPFQKKKGAGGNTKTINLVSHTTHLETEISMGEVEK